MQIQINKFLVVLLASVLLGIGCAPPNTSQNNGMPNSNQNVSYQNTLPNTTTPPIVCTGGIDDGKLKKEIEKLPAAIKGQFKEFNSTGGTVSLSYDASNHDLIFMGYFTSDEKDLHEFFKVFDKIRSKDCARKVYFQGDTAAANFEWRSASAAAPPSDCKTAVDDAINKSDVASQLRKNLEFSFDEKSKVLTLTGYIGDIPGKERFEKFIAQLKPLIVNGCVSKIVFAGQKRADEKTMLKTGFGWMLCEAPLVECAGECVSVCVKEENTNTNR